MYDCSAEVQKFHDEAVRLPESERKKLRGCREANEKRLKDGLKKAGEPAPLRFVKQGSYGMRTTIQHPKNDYDIDDGVLFLKKDLQGAQGAEKTPLEARKMVCNALQDKAFNKKPEITPNCVRVFYNEGHHVDIPVYRVLDRDSTDTVYEIASAEWKKSNPEGVTKWFETCLDRHNGDEEDPQMRRLVRLLKKFSTSRDSWNMPSGFILSVLINEAYARSERDDEAFFNVIRSIKARLDGNLEVVHPVVAGKLTKTSKDTNMVELRDRLGWAIDQLKVTLDSQCTKKQALKAWREVFDTDFFDDLMESQASLAAGYAIAGSAPTRPVDKQGGGRFG